MRLRLRHAHALVVHAQPQAPVVARAAFLFECAHFVHRCNRGHWPSWMKLNLPFYRPSGPLSNRGTPSGQRRTHILQRLGGRMFFSWAEVRRSADRWTERPSDRAEQMGKTNANGDVID